MTASEDLRGALRDMARRMLADETQALGDGDPPIIDWTLLGTVGWLGLEIPEPLGGGGASFAELAVLVEELARHAPRTPFASTAALGGPALLLARPTAVRDRLLGDIAAGDETVAVALAGDQWEGDDLFHVERFGGGFAVRGRGSDVLDAPDAGILLLPAVDPERGRVLVVLRSDHPGVLVESQVVVDPSRTLGEVRVDATVAGVDVLVFEDEHALAHLADRAALVIALDSLGVSEAVLASTVAYVSVREQFGRPVGSFQAVKHACADVHVACAASRALVERAVDLFTAGDASASSAVSMAKAHACESAVDAAGTAMQLHGGIGYTWESGVHRYLKRAILNRSLFGSPRDHRARLVGQLGR